MHFPVMEKRFSPFSAAIKPHLEVLSPHKSGHSLNPDKATFVSHFSLSAAFKT